ncbi:hypothetical protein [Escherichia coli]|nr:hypothetical protein [Escherichia coli]
MSTVKVWGLGDAVVDLLPAVAKAPAVPAIVDGLVILIFLLQIE